MNFLLGLVAGIGVLLMIVGAALFFIIPKMFFAISYNIVGLTPLVLSAMILVWVLILLKKQIVFKKISRLIFITYCVLISTMLVGLMVDALAAFIPRESFTSHLQGEEKIYARYLLADTTTYFLNKGEQAIVTEVHKINDNPSTLQFPTFTTIDGQYAMDFFLKSTYGGTVRRDLLGIPVEEYRVPCCTGEDDLFESSHKKYNQIFQIIIMGIFFTTLYGILILTPIIIIIGIIWLVHFLRKWYSKTI